ncbi:MAG: hypothetical protein IBX55_00110 [Methyloprofundus sp.]|nr:hypothetical protein [Methyloprofundus sp.]
MFKKKVLLAALGSLAFSGVANSINVPGPEDAQFQAGLSSIGVGTSLTIQGMLNGSSGPVVVTGNLSGTAPGLLSSAEYAMGIRSLGEYLAAKIQAGDATSVSELKKMNKTNEQGPEQNIQLESERILTEKKMETYNKLISPNSRPEDACTGASSQGAASAARSAAKRASDISTIAFNSDLEGIDYTAVGQEGRARIEMLDNYQMGPKSMAVMFDNAFNPMPNLDGTASDLTDVSTAFRTRAYTIFNPKIRAEVPPSSWDTAEGRAYRAILRERNDGLSVYFDGLNSVFMDAMPVVEATGPDGNIDPLILERIPKQEDGEVLPEYRDVYKQLLESGMISRNALRDMDVSTFNSVSAYVKRNSQTTEDITLLREQANMMARMLEVQTDTLKSVNKLVAMQALKDGRDFALQYEDDLARLYSQVSK